MPETFFKCIPIFCVDEVQGVEKGHTKKCGGRPHEGGGRFQYLILWPRTNVENNTQGNKTKHET